MDSRWQLEQSYGELRKANQGYLRILGSWGTGFRDTDTETPEQPDTTPRPSLTSAPPPLDSPIPEGQGWHSRRLFGKPAPAVPTPRMPFPTFSIFQIGPNSSPFKTLLHPAPGHAPGWNSFLGLSPPGDPELTPQPLQGLCIDWECLPKITSLHPH